MTTYLLIRHGNTDVIGKTLVGRMRGIHLNEEGRAQAEALAERLSGEPIQAICSSPLERTRETAEPLAKRLKLDILICEGITEVDYGDWAGFEVRDLGDDPLWRQYNTFRSGARIPGGELMVEIQMRMVTEVNRLRALFPESVLAVFSHGDPIKALICHYAGIPLDFLTRLTISPASVSILTLNDYGPQIHCINATGDLSGFLHG
jgi:probable phosphoglycerate mutase